MTYSLLLTLALLVSAPYWFFRMLRQGKHREGLRQRLGMLPPQMRAVAASGKPVIWMHAVSVGEVLAVEGLIQQMRARFAGFSIVISTTTRTGHKLAGERFGAENVFYFPLDLGFAMGRYMRLLRPKLVVIAETEFWPNFLRQAGRHGARIAVVNARISDRSFPRYRRLRRLLRPVLRGIDLFLAQSAEDQRRLLCIGAPQERVFVGGNLKFDAAIPARRPEIEQLRSRIRELSATPVVVFGSTVEGEEQMLLEVFRGIAEQHPRALIILAPRHRERFSLVADLLSGCGIPFTRRSEQPPRNIEPGSVLLLDTIGELASIYSLADVAFVGGSLAPRGGHNILEPASFAIPIIVGPHTENFRDIVLRFEALQFEARRSKAEPFEAQRSKSRQVEARPGARGGAAAAAEPTASAGAAVFVVADAAQLLSTVLRLLDNPAEGKLAGERALEIVSANRGATERALGELERLLARRSS